MNNYNLIITGFMGTGKTTVGKLVAEKLNRPFIDTDDLISERLNKTVPEIFAAYGETFFRALESSICKELAEPNGLVIATGGGTLIRWDNASNIKGEGNVIFCLWASPDEIFHRLINDTRGRPMIDNHKNPKQAAINLLEARRTDYEKIRVQVQTTGRETEDIANEIIRRFHEEVDCNQIRTSVQTPHSLYEIYCDNGLLDQVPDILKAHHLNGKAIIATNTTVAPLYGEALAKRLGAELITMQDGEQYKNLDTITAIHSQFAQAGLDRNGVVIALGGGVVGDTMGFAAASYMRGVRLVQMPTSLLAMVDSSVGGKVGVDIPEGKNLVGAFKQPELVIIDPNVLQTLPEIEVQCGLAEAMKHGLIADPGLLELSDQIAQGDADALRRTIQVKIDIVQRDPYEKGERAFLNLGHTFAHALERVSNYQYQHGVAVGIGLVGAAKLSHALGHLSASKTDQVIEIVQKIGLPTSYRDFEPIQIWDAMKTDKKWRDGRSHFIILEDIGKAKSVHDVPKEQVIEVLESLKSE